MSTASNRHAVCCGHAAERHFTILRILDGDDLWVSECVITYDGAPTYVAGAS